jgi:hypothetical protein
LGKRLEPNDGNWALELHGRLLAVIPPVSLKLRATIDDNGGSVDMLEEECQLLMQLHGWKIIDRD